MPTFGERLRSAWSAFQSEPPPPREGEIAFMDPRRLFPGGAVTQYNPSWLVSRKSLKIFEVMRRDDQVKAALAFKKHTILASGWTVTSPEGEEKDWEVTRFVDDCLRRLDQSDTPGSAIEGTFEQDLLEILSALDYGFSVSELVYDDVPEGDFAGNIGLSAIKTRSPHDFTFEQDEFGNLLPNGLVQNGNIYAPGGHLPVDKFVFYIHQGLFGNLYGTSDLESAYRAWWSKDASYKWLVMLLERLGIPPIFGLYNPNNYTPQQQTELRQVFTNLQAASFGIMPRPNPDALAFWTPELADQATRVFIPALDMFNKDISRAILMPGLLGMTPDLATGSYARAQVQFDVFIEVVEHIRRTLRTNVVQNQIIRPLVDLNYGSQMRYPQFEFLPISDEVRLDLLAQWVAMVQANVVTAQDADEAHVRKMVRFPERDQTAPRELPGQQPIQAPAMPKASNGQPSNGNGNEPATTENRQYAEGECTWVTIAGNHICIEEGHAHKTPKVPHDPAVMTAKRINAELDRLDRHDSAVTSALIDAGRGHEKPTEIRTKTDPLSQRFNAILDRRHKLRMEIERRYGPGAPHRLPERGFGPIKAAVQEDEDYHDYAVRAPNYARIDQNLNLLQLQAQREISGTLAASLLAMKASAADILRSGQASEIDRLVLKTPDLLYYLRNFFTLTYGAGVSGIREEAPLQATRFIPVPGGRQFATAVSHEPTDALRYLEAKAVQVMGAMSDRILTEVKQVLLNALRFGETQPETLKKLDAVFEPYIGNPNVLRNGQPIPAAQLETILRTNATDAYNAGRLASARDIGGFLSGMRYSAVLDNRTTEVCRYLDGKVFPMHEPALDQLSPPNHYNCRSILVPVTADVPLDEADYVTQTQIGRAMDLAQEGFK